MEHYAGIDVFLDSASACIVDAQGKIVKEAKLLSEPEVLTAWSAAHEVQMTRIGLEAGPLSHPGALLRVRHPLAGRIPAFETGSGRGFF